MISKNAVGALIRLCQKHEVIDKRDRECTEEVMKDVVNEVGKERLIQAVEKKIKNCNHIIESGKSTNEESLKQYMVALKEGLGWLR